MIEIDTVLIAACYVLAALTVWEASRGWFRSKNPFHIDILLVIGVLIVILVAGQGAAALGAAHPVLGVVFTTLFLAQPFLLLRLAAHFGRAPQGMLWLSATVAIVGAAVMRQPANGSPLAQLVISLYFAGMLSYCAHAFGREAAETAGVSARRLRFVAAGTWIHALIAVVFGLQAAGVTVDGWSPHIRRALGVLMFGCYYIGLIGPSYLRAAWAQRVLYTHFRDATLRPRGEGVANAAEELAHAAGHTVASSARAVLFFDAEDHHVLSVRAATPASLNAVHVQPSSGLLGLALNGRRAVVGPPGACEPAVAEWAGEAGSQVIVVPVSGPLSSWGVLVVVQKSGSLFPDHDAELLELVCRHTALTLEHARLVGASRDAERQAFQQRLTQVQRIEAIGQLAAGTAHDFNNLLTAVMGYLHAIKSHPRYDRALDDFIDGIRMITRRATDLTDRLVAFSRRDPPRTRQLDLGVVVADLVPVVERVLTGGMQVHFTPPPHPVPVMTDPVQMGQVLINLALNARDAMPNGGRLTIAVTSVELDDPRQVGSGVLVAGRYARLIVSDSGVGMDALTRSRIFEPFFTTKSEGGNGLGLPTVQAIVSEMGGAIGVDSAQGFGATFDLYFPLADQPAVTETDSVLRPDPGGSETILFVENHDTVRAQVLHWLLPLGYRVVAVRDGDEARRVAATLGRLHLIIADVFLPGATGPEIVAAIASSHPGIKALYVSGYPREMLVRHAVVAESDRLIQKPFDGAELARRTREALEDTPGPGDLPSAAETVH